MFYVHIDIFRNLRYFVLRYLIKAFYCNFTMYNTLYHTLYTTVFLKMNPRGQNM